MSQDSKHPNGALNASRHGLLNELDDIRSLLGEDDADGLDIPLLEPEGDGHTQIPLLDSHPTADPAATDAHPLHQALAERENPFLPRAAIERLAREREQMPAALRPTPTPTPPPAPAPAPALQPQRDTPDLDDRAMRALVDETLAVWLPRIERELRERLLRELRGEDD